MLASALIDKVQALVNLYGDREVQLIEALYDVGGPVESVCIIGDPAPTVGAPILLITNE